MMFIKINKDKFDKFSSNIANLILFVIALLLVFSILSSISYAQVPCTKDTDCKTGQVCGTNKFCRDCITSAECLSKTFLRSTPLGGVSPWFSISISILLLVLTAVAIFYMIAYAFQSDQFKRIAFAELMQVLASFILIGLLFGFEIFERDLLTQMETTSNSITAALILSTGTAGTTISSQIQINPFEVSYAFLRNMLTCAENGMKNMYTRSELYQRLMNFELSFILETKDKKIEALPLPNPMAFVESLAKQAAKYEYDANELMWLTIFLYAQIAVLKFIETSMFTVFLPIGIILRSFPPTRGAGAVLMAIAIGFYIVYPLIFTILYVGTPPVIDGCNVKAPIASSTTEQTCPVNIGAVSNTLSSASDAAVTLDADMPRIESGITSMRFAAFIYMLISLGGTFIFIRSLSSILGADISEIGRTMFRML